MFNHIVVPDVVGMPFVLACRMGDDAGLTVSGIGRDGRGVDPDSEAVVVAQDPAALARARRGERLVLHTGGPGGGAGDREPRDPVPLEHEGHGDVNRPDGEPELDPVPA